MPSDINLLMEDANLIFRNFAGEERQYNRKGDRNFCVTLHPDAANEMLKDGWNVKYLKAREEGDEPQAYIQTTVSFKGRPPTLVMVTSRGRTNVPEDMVEMFDWVEIKTVDLIIRPYDWEVSGKTGRKAYLKSMYLTLDEDYLALKYAHVQEIGAEENHVLDSKYDGLPILDGEVVPDRLAIGN